MKKMRLVSDTMGLPIRGNLLYSEWAKRGQMFVYPSTYLVGQNALGGLWNKRPVADIES